MQRRGGCRREAGDRLQDSAVLNVKRAAGLAHIPIIRAATMLWHVDMPLGQIERSSAEIVRDRVHEQPGERRRLHDRVHGQRNDLIGARGTGRRAAIGRGRRHMQRIGTFILAVRRIS